MAKASKRLLQPKGKRVRVITGVGEIKFKGGIPHLLMEVDGKVGRYVFALNTLMHLHHLSKRSIDRALVAQFEPATPNGEAA